MVDIESRWSAVTPKCCTINETRTTYVEKLHIYFSKTSSLPSLINLYLTSILLLMPINRPREIISKKSKAMVASSTVELLAYINPRRLGENKLPINNIDIMMRDAVPTT